jgi:hypothetical protein
VTDIVRFDGNKILKQAVLSNNYLSLNDISVNFPRKKNLFFLSYEESKSITEYIDTRYGSESLINILRKLHQGGTIEESVLSELSIDLYELERSWHSHLRRKYTWMRYISDNIYWLLFFIGAVVTVVGFIILKIRMRSLPDDEEDEYMDIEH